VEALCSWVVSLFVQPFVCLFVCLSVNKSCAHDILKTNKLIFDANWDKWSTGQGRETVNFRGQNSEGQSTRSRGAEVDNKNPFRQDCSRTDRYSLFGRA